VCLRACVRACAWHVSVRACVRHGMCESLTKKIQGGRAATSVNQIKINAV
jgi:hypothetical protein